MHTTKVIFTPPTGHHVSDVTIRFNHCETANHVHDPADIPNFTSDTLTRESGLYLINEMAYEMQRLTPDSKETSKHIELLKEFVISSLSKNL